MNEINIAKSETRRFSGNEFIQLHGNGLKARPDEHLPSSQRTGRQALANLSGLTEIFLTDRLAARSLKNR